MLGSDDLRPEARRHAPDLSVEEMLRRARGARLGETPQLPIADVQPPRFMPFSTGEQRLVPGEWLHSSAVLMLGLLLGICFTFALVHAGASENNPAPTPVVAQLPPTPTDTPVPRPTDTPLPAPTAAPSYPTADQIVSLAQDYIDNQSEYAGSYVMTGQALLQVQSQDETQLSVCMQFGLASVDTPDIVVLTDTRLFVLSPDINESWHVVETGDSASCSLN